MIERPEQLRAFVDAARACGEVALDTEFLRERTYLPQLCLIQAAYADAPAQCIDPLALDDLSPLNELLGDARVVKIFHSCRQDLEALDSRFEFRAANIYDTQLAAAFCGFGEQVSYAALVDELCAVHLPKAHTRADWSRRPLPPEQLQYALDDVRHLATVRHELDSRLRAQQREQWHRDECARAAHPHSYRLEVDSAWRRLAAFDKLDSSARACAKQLTKWREQRAVTRNLPRGWILSDRALVQLCRMRPTQVAQLSDIADLAPKTIRREGETLLKLIASGAQHQPQTETSAWLNPEQRKCVKKIMQLLEQRATQAQISRALLANRRDIENFMRGETDLPLFSGWRAQLVGDEIRALVVADD